MIFTSNQSDFESNLLMLLHIYPSVINSVRRLLLNDPHTFHCCNYLAFGGIRTCLRVSSSDPMFLWIYSNSCPLSFYSLFEATKQRGLSSAFYPRTGQRDHWVLVELRLCSQVYDCAKTTPLPSR